MKLVVINALTALMLMLVQTNVDSAFGIHAVAQFGVIAVVLSGMMSMSMTASAVAMLLLGLFCDVFASGPHGIYAFAFMIVFGLCRAMISRFRSERIIAVMIFSAVMSVLFELIQALLLSAYYWNTIYLSIFSSVFWADMLLTAGLSPVMMWIVHGFESLLARRKKNSLL